MRRQAPLLLALTVVIATVTAAAAAPSLDVRVEPPRIGVEDVTRLVVRVGEPTGAVARPEITGLDNLELAGGPSTSNEIQVVNGRVSRTMSFTWVLRPRAVGQATVGAVSVAVDGTTLVSDPVTIEVVAGSLAPPPRSRRQSPFGPFDPFAGFGDPRLRRAAPEARLELRQLVSDDQLVLGQTVTVAVALDSTVGGIESFEWVDAPTYPGWWTQRVELPESISPTPVEIDGVAYNRFIIARNVLVALKTGKLEIPPVRARIGVGGRSLFATPQVVERASAAAPVEIAPRPAAPAGFVGAVGDLSYRAEIDPRHIEFGESTVITVTLRGTGNLPLVEAPPAFTPCPDCEIYPPEEDSDLKVEASGISGSRTWRTTVVPRSAGSMTFGGMTVAVFDPAAGHYTARQLGPFELVVDPPPATPTPTVDPALTPVPTRAAAGVAADSRREGDGAHVPAWLIAAATGLAGVLLGGIAAWALARRRRRLVPPRRSGQTAAERARELQATLERWWIEARERSDADQLRGEMEALRRELEAVRFAPGRADHSETVAELEQRLRRLL